MACCHPLRAFPTGALTAKGKPCYFVTTHRYKFATADDFIKRGLPFRFLKVDDFIEIPCGHCVGCKKDAQRRWAFRLMAESLSHQYAYFVTLTYSTDPKSLSKRDLQLFHKRLRKLFPFRFFACGEYGEKNHRPHYHGVYFFDVPLRDLKLWSNKGSYKLFNSDTFTRVWRKGFVVLGTLTPASCGYCAKYCLKQFDNPVGLEPPFIIMSRSPGIGDAFFKEHLKPGLLSVPSGSGSVLHGSLPRYAKNKFCVDNPFKDVQDLGTLSRLRDYGFTDVDQLRELDEWLLKHPSLVSFK